MDTKKVYELMRKTRDTISDPGTWCTHYLALDRDGKARTADSGEAVRWCVLGAMQRTLGWAGRSPGRIDNLAEYIAAANGWHDTDFVCRLVQVNNLEGHAAVLAVLDSTLRYLESVLAVEAAAEQVAMVAQAAALQVQEVSVP